MIEARGLVCHCWDNDLRGRMYGSHLRVHKDSARWCITCRVSPASPRGARGARKSEKPCRGRPGVFQKFSNTCITFRSLSWGATWHALALNLGGPAIL